MAFVRLLILTALFAAGGASPSFSQELERERRPQAETKVSSPNSTTEKAKESGPIFFLFGAFCALWAQNTGRNAWLWFFLGGFFSVITVLFLLTKNSNDLFEKKKFGRTAIE